MSKFTFTHEDGRRTISMEIEEYQLDDILAYFADFLRGCGFQIKGEERLDVVNDFEDHKPIEPEENIFKVDAFKEYHKNQIFYKNAPLENYKVNWYTTYGSIPDILAQGKNNG
jgi:hypothetical protein